MTTADKILSDDEQLSQRLERRYRPLVFTNGCFDILHRGHVAYLEEAAALGKTLLVAVNSDVSIAKLDKGANRPINPLHDRMALLAALGFVDLVIGFDAQTPIDLIHRARPEHLVKGGDWPTNQIIGGDFVSQLGGQVHSLPFDYSRSTSELIRQIQKSETDS